MGVSKENHSRGTGMGKQAHYSLRYSNIALYFHGYTITVVGFLLLSYFVSLVCYKQCIL